MSTRLATRKSLLIAITIISIIVVIITIFVVLNPIKAKQSNEFSSPSINIQNKAHKATELVNQSQNESLNEQNSAANNEKPPSLITKYIPETDMIGTLLNNIERLKSEYKAGNLESGYILATQLQKCYSKHTSKEEFNDDLNQWYKDNENISDIRQREQEFYHCFGVSKQQRAEYFTIFEALANKSYPPAQVMYAFSTAPEDIEKYASLTNKADIIALQAKTKKTQIYYLEEAAQGGSLTAMSLLSLEYSDNKSSMRNLPKALAHQLTLLNLLEFSSHYDQLKLSKDSLLQKMSTSQIQKAEILSEALIKTVRRNGILYAFD